MYTRNNSYSTRAFESVRPGHDTNYAVAMIKGGPDYPQITGTVTFQSIPYGTRVCADIAGLPPYRPAENGKQPVGPFGFHIHEYGDCKVGDPAKPFEACGGHWNPTNQPHGNHANRGKKVFKQLC